MIAPRQVRLRDQEIARLRLVVERQAARIHALNIENKRFRRAIAKAVEESDRKKEELLL